MSKISLEKYRGCLIGGVIGDALGVINGESSIPEKWIEKLRYSDIVFQIAEDIDTKIKGSSYEIDEEWMEKYPGF